MSDCLVVAIFLVVIFGIPIFLFTAGDHLPKIKNCQEQWYPKTEYHNCD